MRKLPSIIMNVVFLCFINNSLIAQQTDLSSLRSMKAENSP